VSQRRLPAEIYWRRRLLLLAVVILIVWGVLRLTGDDGGDPEPAPRPAASSAAPSASPATTPPADGAIDVTLVSATRDCDPEDVRITPTVRAGQTVREPVDIGLVVSTIDPKPCTLTPADADLVVVISANDTAIWDSTVCKDSLLTKAVPLSPRWATLTPTQWSGRGSGAGCSPKEGWATPGRYEIQVGTLGGEPGRATFTLEKRAPAPKPKPTTTEPTTTKPTPPQTPATEKPND
jgi:hypothetical protein